MVREQRNGVEADADDNSSNGAMDGRRDSPEDCEVQLRGDYSVLDEQRIA